MVSRRLSALANERGRWLIEYIVMIPHAHILISMAESSIIPRVHFEKLQNLSCMLALALLTRNQRFWKSWDKGRIRSRVPTLGLTGPKEETQQAAWWPDHI